MEQEEMRSLQQDLRSNGLRLTRQRKEILQVLRRVKSHPTAEWVHGEVKKVLPNISLGTVYRNLNFLKRFNLVLKLDCGESFSRYDGEVKKHYHVRCLGCGRIDDLKMAIERQLDHRVEELIGYQISAHRLEFLGTCPDCLSRQALGLGQRTEELGVRK